MASLIHAVPGEEVLHQFQMSRSESERLRSIDDRLRAIHAENQLILVSPVYYLLLSTSSYIIKIFVCQGLSASHVQIIFRNECKFWYSTHLCCVTYYKAVHTQLHFARQNEPCIILLSKLAPSMSLMQPLPTSDLQALLDECRSGEQLGTHKEFPPRDENTNKLLD